MGMFQTLQPFIGSLVAIAAAMIGFGGVIYSQRRIARVAEQGRLHQERMAEEQAQRLRQRERESLVNAMVGELSALQFSVDAAARLLHTQAAMAEDLARKGDGRRTQPRVVFRFPTPVFDNLVAKVGLLGPELSFSVSKYYGQIKSYAVQSQDQVPEMDAALAAQVMRSVEDSLAALVRDAETLKAALIPGFQGPGMHT